MNRFIKSASICVLSLGMAGGALAQSDGTTLEDDNFDDSQSAVITCETFLNELDTAEQLEVTQELMVMAGTTTDSADSAENIDDTATIDADVNAVVDACQERNPDLVSEIVNEMMGMDPVETDEVVESN